MTDNVIRVVLVDDHGIVRDGLRALLCSVDDIDIVGEAASGEEALDVVAATRPDVVLMDIEMPGIGGVEATRRITGLDDSPAVLVLTMYTEDAFVFASLRAGARGYLVKGAHQEDVLRAIRGVARGDAVFGPHVAEQLLHALGSVEATAVAFPQLTARERDILELASGGLSNNLIARRLGLTPKTVANYMSTIITKLGSTSRAEAIEMARRVGLGSTQL